MLTSVSGFYFGPHSGVWLADEPEGIAARFPRMYSTIEPSILWEEVFRRDLSSGICITGHRMGVFKFHFLNYPGGMSPDAGEALPDVDTLLSVSAERIKVMNAFSLCVHSAMLTVGGRDFRVSQLVYDDIIVFGDDDVEGEYRSMSGSAVSALGSIHRLGAISLDVLEASADLLDSVMQSGAEGAIEMIALLNHALAAYKEHNFALSVVLSWTICEKLLGVRWVEHAHSPDFSGVLVSGEWRHELARDKEHNAFTMTKTLTSVGKIPDLVSMSLNEARSARNNWLHNSLSVSAETAGAALQCVCDMLKEVAGVEVKVGLVFNL